MALFRSAAERRLWILAFGYTAAIYASAYPLQLALLALRERGLLRLSVSAVLLLAALVLAVAAWRQRPGPAEVVLLMAGAGLYLWMLSEIRFVQNRLHLLLYGILGGLFYASLRRRWHSGEEPRAAGRRWYQHFPGLWAVLLTLAAGWGDELIQHYIPNRTYALSDVALNGIAGCVAVALLALRRGLRRWEQAAESALVEGGRPPLP